MREWGGVVSAFVRQVTRKAWDQVDAELADFRRLERLCDRWGRELGRIEFPAAILNAGDQRSCIALQLDRNPQAVVLCAAAVHNDVGDSFLKAKLNCKRGVGRQLLLGLGLDPSRQPFQFGKVTAQLQTVCLQIRHRSPDSSASRARLCPRLEAESLVQS